MWMVEGEFPDYTAYNNSGWFRLNVDQAFNHQTWEPPIHWEGLVNSVKVKFIQTSHMASSIYDFDFEGFPKEVEDAKSYIVEAIDDAMRVMD